MKSLLFRHVSLIVCLGTAVLFAGCSDTDENATVSGQITLDGKPLPAGVILFEDSANGVGGSAVVENGAFVIPTPLPTGKYAVALQPPPLPAPHESNKKGPRVKLPQHLTRPATSGLEADLTPGENALDFKVASK